MVEHGLDCNHIMTTEFTNNHKLDAKNIGETIFKLHEKIEHLQACRRIVTADVLELGLSRGAIATRKLKGVNRTRDTREVLY